MDRYISKSEKFFLRCWTLERHNNDLCNQAKKFFFLSGFCIFFTAKCIVLNLKSNRIKETISLTTFPEHTTSESIYMVSWIILFISMLVCFACKIIYIIFIFLKKSWRISRPHDKWLDSFTTWNLYKNGIKVT